MANAASAAALVGEWNYFFLNVSSENGIQVYRWKGVDTAPVKGKVLANTIKDPAKFVDVNTTGTAIATLPVFEDGTIRLYYTGPGEKRNSSILHEIYLENAGSDDVDITKWKAGNLDKNNANARIANIDSGLTSGPFVSEGKKCHRVYYQGDAAGVLQYAQVIADAWTFGTVQLF
jgi:hypothetical protein